MRRTAGYTWTDYKTNTNHKRIKNNTNFGKITGI